MSQVCHKSTKYTFNVLCYLWEGALKHTSSEMSPLRFHKRHWCFIDISPRLLISAAMGVFPPFETTSLPLVGKVQQSKRRKVPAAVSRRTWLPEEPPAHTDTAPEPKHKARRSDIHVQTHTAPPPRCALCAPTSLVFLMICCRRMRKFSGSLFTISSRLQRFMDWPAEHISTREVTGGDETRIHSFPSKKKAALESECVSDRVVNAQKDAM